MRARGSSTSSGPHRSSSRTCLTIRASSTASWSRRRSRSTASSPTGRAKCGWSWIVSSKALSQAWGSRSRREVTMAMTAPFQTLEPQTRQNLNVDAYAHAALSMSRLAAMILPTALDVHYGQQAWQKLDIYMPPGQGKGLPVCIMLHGGGMDHGYKEWMGLNAPAITAFPAIMVSVQYKLGPLDLAQ